MNIRGVWFLVLGLLINMESMAWGMQGHRVIGQIADSYLSNKARRNIHRILGNESIAMASTWADFIKSDSNYNHFYNWHFINFLPDLSKEEFNTFLQSDTAVDAYTKLNFLTSKLASHDLGVDEQQMYLRLLIHIVGDMHQPMHAGRLSDLGGNKIRLSWFNEPTNLHRIWDEQLIEYQQLSYTEYTAAINFTTRQQRQEWQQQPTSEWLFESYTLATRLYNYPIPADGKLSFKYNFDHISILNGQLLKGGVRLAGILNELFG